MTAETPYMSFSFPVGERVAHFEATRPRRGCPFVATIDWFPSFPAFPMCPHEIDDLNAGFGHAIAELTRLSDEVGAPQQTRIHFTSRGVVADPMIANASPLWSAAHIC